VQTQHLDLLRVASESCWRRQDDNLDPVSDARQVLEPLSRGLWALVDETDAKHLQKGCRVRGPDQQDTLHVSTRNFSQCSIVYEGMLPKQNAVVLTRASVSPGDSVSM
jgi:hypothetical protein